MKEFTDSLLGRAKSYYYLTKPGIIRGNLITALAGFFLASAGNIDVWLLLATLSGLSAVIASAAVFNNYIDKELDAKMERTKGRALAAGLISGRKALAYGFLLGVLGGLILSFYSNWKALVVAAAGFFIYVLAYSIWKRRTVGGTVVGSLSGATPPVVGYVAVTDNFDGAALLLFVILMLWQMPHFYAIGIYRLKDYGAAGLAILPVKRGVEEAKLHIVFYVLAFNAAVVTLSAAGYTGLAYLVVTSVFGLAWLWMASKGFGAASDRLWARGMFRFSLIVIAAWSAAVSLDAWLP